MAEVQDQEPVKVNSDYDLDNPITSKVGLRQGLASYGDPHFSLFLRKVFIKALGYSEDALSRPIIGIVNTYSSFNPCHANIPQLIDAVKRGVQLNGGLAIDFPTISIHESFSSPTSMYLRNLMSMDTEEMISAQPCDAVVLIGGECIPTYIPRMILMSRLGCDKTTPAQLMGGISANKPVLHLVTGPMMPGSHRGVRIGACTDCRNNWAKYRAGTIDIEDISAINDELAPTVSGHSKSGLSLHLLTQPKGGNLRCNGHCKHNGVYSRWPWNDALRWSFGASRLLIAAPYRRGDGEVRSRGHKTARHATTTSSFDPRVVSKRHHGAPSYRRFDKCSCAPHGDRRTTPEGRRYHRPGHSR